MLFFGLGIIRVVCTKPNVLYVCLMYLEAAIFQLLQTLFVMLTKMHLRRMVAGERPLSTENFRQPAPVGAKSPILNQYSLVAP